MTSRTKLTKFGIPVRIAMSDRTQIIGVVFVHQGQRVLDVLCDDRPFFPIQTTAGGVSKSCWREGVAGVRAAA